MNNLKIINTSKEEYILEVQDIIYLTQLRWISILELMRKGEFPYPAPALLGMTTIVWRYDEVMKWLSKYHKNY